MSETTLSFSQSELSVLREKYKGKLTDVEFDAFLEACKRYQLNPLANQIYARVQPATPKNAKQVTYCAQIDGYRLIADRTHQYAGNDDPAYDEETKQPAKATVTVYKLVGGVRCPFTATARWSQYCPGGNQAFMWTKMPHLMLGKCAEALALRKAFPAELSGLYTLEEMHQADAGQEPEAPKQQGKPATKPAPAPSTNGKKPAPEKPPAKQPTIADAPTPAQMVKLLRKFLAAHPVGTAAEKWEGIYKQCFDAVSARVNKGDWKMDDTGELSDVLDDIKNQLTTAKQGQETFSA
jgi:phage recombination protein Bet